MKFVDHLFIFAMRNKRNYFNSRQMAKREETLNVWQSLKLHNQSSPICLAVTQILLKCFLSLPLRIKKKIEVVTV